MIQKAVGTTARENPRKINFVIVSFNDKKFWFKSNTNYNSFTFTTSEKYLFKVWYAGIRDLTISFAQKFNIHLRQ